jgi:cytochrome c-type biogenesis protein CcmE
MRTGSKLAFGATIIASVAAYLAYAGARSSWQYYLTVDECVAQGSEIVGSPLRVHGRVDTGSLQIDRQKQLATFRLASDTHVLDVTCTGTIPDNLTEGMEVVVEGTLDTGLHVRGHKLMTKCSSKYASQGTS